MAKELIKCSGPQNQFIDIDKLLPSRLTVSRHIDSNYSMFNSRVLTDIENVKYFGLTCDDWVHDVTKNNDLTVTAIFKRLRFKSSGYSHSKSYR